jgi:hypothetical protein
MDTLTLIDSIKRKPLYKKKDRIEKDVEKDILSMQSKLRSIARVEESKKEPNKDELAEQYLEKEKKEYIEGEEKFNKIHKDAYGKRWSLLTKEEQENALKSYFEGISESYFGEDKKRDDFLNDCLKRLDEGKLRTIKDIEYDRVNKRIIKICDLKFDVNSTQYYWVIKKEKKKNLLKKFLGKKK